MAIGHNGLAQDDAVPNGMENVYSENNEPEVSPIFATLREIKGKL